MKHNDKLKWLQKPDEKADSLEMKSLRNAAKAVKSIRAQRNYEGDDEMMSLALKHSEEAMFTLASRKSDDDEEQLRNILKDHDLDDLMY